MKTLTCPECESPEVAVCSEDSFMANTGEFYCHSVKTHDDGARAFCTKCNWEGKRFELTGYGDDE